MADTTEIHIALREAYQIAASDSFFAARKELRDTEHERYIFDAGFRRGFDVHESLQRKPTPTQPADAALADEVTENLVALVGRLSHQLSKATPGHRLPVKAMAYLEQIGFKFHVARHGGPEAATQGKEPETIWRWYALDHTGYCYGANPPSNLPERCCLTAFHRHMDATEAAAALRARAVPDELPLFDAAIAVELPCVSVVPYNSKEICTWFAKNVRERMLAASKAAEGK